MDTWNGKVTVDSKEYEVKWEHDRFDYLKDREVIQPEIKANTFCFIGEYSQDKVGINFCNGWASCSWSDNFCRRTGRKLSLQRALLNSDFTEQQRRQVWEQVLSIKGLVR